MPGDPTVSLPDAARRVAVTGLGVVCPLGNGVAALTATLQEGRVCLARRSWTLADGELAALVGPAELPEHALTAREARRLDRVSQLALAAARAAWADAAEPELHPTRGGVFCGVGFGGLATVSEGVAVLAERGARRLSPFFIPNLIANAPAGHVSETLGLLGPSLTYTTACAASSTAIGEAFLRIRSGELDLAVAGGAEAALDPLAVAGFAAARALAPPEVGARPFAVERRGFLLGEGAVFLVLEDWGRALERRTPIYGELVGYGQTSDAHHITEPDPEGRGAERAVRAALKQAGLRPAQLDYVNAHATGTLAGDAVEAAMFARLLGESADQVAISSTKGLSGHLLGAAGALEAAISLVALTTGVLPPNLPCDEPDPAAVGLNLVREAGRRAPLRHVLSTSFGFGGVNAALVFRAADLEIEHRPGS